MAIVVDLNGAPPGRTGNQTGIDPHNETKLEKAFNNDVVDTDASVTLAIGNQVVLAADPVRRAVMLANPNANDDVAYGFVTLAAVDGVGAITLFAGNAISIQGKLAGKAIHVYSPSAQKLTILYSRG